ncbi:Phage terminase, endonuclease small subunit M [Escherichia coli]|uniref:Phage terminase, endonuclease small subunit M n=1 Tax=Escherichia coli TaxID=562 RepID=A0A376K0C1_ECOLX|nr:Phage terminase, endonuclease small subunit M [Escherichia coli]
MITPAQQHWQNVMAQRAGRANEGVDHAARTAHEEVLYRLRLAQARLKGVQARSAKADIKKALLPDFSGWIEGTLEADGGQQDEVIATLIDGIFRLRCVLVRMRSVTTSSCRITLAVLLPQC